MILFLVLLITNCERREDKESIEFIITKVFLDINDYDHADLPPTIYLELKIINNTKESIALNFYDRYSNKINSRMVMFSPILNQMMFLGGFPVTTVQQKQFKTIEIEVDLNNKENNYFGISKEFFEERGLDFSKDIDFLLGKIQETFEHSVPVAYLNSEDLNHLNPTNQANKYLKEDHVIQVKWAKNLKYELYQEKPPLPVVNNINIEDL